MKSCYSSFAFALPCLLAFTSACDAPSPRASDPSLWNFCPQIVESTEIEEGDFWLQSAPDVVLCSLPNFATPDVMYEKQTQSQLRLVPGDLSLPLTQGAYTLDGFGTCSRSLEDERSSSARVTWRVQREDNIDDTFVKAQLTQELGNDEVLHLQLQGNLRWFERGFVIDEEVRFGETQNLISELFSCTDNCEGENAQRRYYDQCALPNGVLGTHEFRAPNDDRIHFEVRARGFHAASWARLVRVYGRLNGREFEETNFYDLAYAPSGPYDNRRDFEIHLTEAVSGVCDISARKLNPWGGNWESEVTLRYCDGETSRWTPEDGGQFGFVREELSP